MKRQRLVAVLVGVVLLVATGLKAYGLAVDPVSPIGLLSVPAVQSAVILLEAVAGLWLLWGGHPVGAWTTATGLFVIFAGVSLYQGMIGQASCGCFGRLALSPWYAFGLDAVVLTALLFG